MFTSSHACIPQNENGAVKVKKRSLLGRSSSHGCIYDQSSTFKDFENANENSLCKFYPYFRTTNKLTPRILRCTASTHVHNNSRWLLDLLEYIHKTSNIPKTHTHPKKKNHKGSTTKWSNQTCASCPFSSSRSWVVCLSHTRTDWSSEPDTTFPLSELIARTVLQGEI